MLITRMLVWLCLPNLSLHSLHLSILKDIGNTLGKYIKIYVERYDVALCTYALICIEIHLNEGILDNMFLKRDDFRWTQVLDFFFPRKKFIILFQSRTKNVRGSLGSLHCHILAV